MRPSRTIFFLTLGLKHLKFPLLFLLQRVCVHGTGVIVGKVEAFQSEKMKMARNARQGPMIILCPLHSSETPWVPLWRILLPDQYETSQPKCGLQTPYNFLLAKYGPWWAIPAIQWSPGVQFSQEVAGLRICALTLIPLLAAAGSLTNSGQSSC